MAVFTGVLIGSLVASLYQSDDPVARHPFYSNNGANPVASSMEANVPTDVGAAPLTTVVEQQFPVSHGGVKVEAYGAIFYNRIIVSPATLNFGNLLVDATLQIEVFNAFLTTKTLDGISQSNLDGVTLTGPTPPTAFAALQSILYNVEALTGEGPPTINGAYLFDFEAGIDDVTVSVVGQRILALPYLFQAGLKETLSWQTKVITSNNGYEQRMKTRRCPRQEFSFDIGIQSDQLSFLDSLMYAWRGNYFGLPISSEARNLTSPVSITDLVINVPTTFGDFREGGLVMIYNGPNDLEMLNIESLTSSTITVTTGATKAFTVDALVMPLRISRLLSHPKRKTTGHKVRLNANFQVTENTALVTAASAIQYKGLDVYLEQPLTLGEYAIDTYTSRVDVIDFGTGVADTFAPWLKTKIQRNFGVQFESQEDAWNFRLWLHRREGKLRPFWMPTFESNFKLLSVGGLTTELKVKDEGQASLSTGRNDIAIETASGWILREVTNKVVFAGDVLLTLDSSVAIDASEVLGISWLGRKRLSSDRLILNWTGNNTGNATLPILELNN